ncbi:MAG: hypothetical protein RR048_06535 [Oscillospiraceae bacterium]
MKNLLLKKEEKVTLGIFSMVVVLVIAEITLVINLFKLVSRGNKALKIYINKNKYFENLIGNKSCHEDEYGEDEDIPF